MILTLADWAASAMTWANVVVFALLAWRQYLNYRAVRRPITLIFIIIGGYWALFYLYVGLIQIGWMPDIFGQIWLGRIFVRPAFLATGCLMLILAESRARRSNTKPLPPADTSPR